MHQRLNWWVALISLIIFTAGKAYGNIERVFTKNRTTLPLMFIATPGDKYGSTWTKRTPSAPILQRLVLLAKQSYSVLEKQLTDTSSEQDFKVRFSETVFGIQVTTSMVDPRCGQIFPENGMKMKEILPRGGDHPSATTPNPHPRLPWIHQCIFKNTCHI